MGGDPLDQGKQAVAHAALINEWLETGKGELGPDPDWHLPDLLNTEAQLLAQPFEDRRKSPVFQPRSAVERSALELERYRPFCLTHEHLPEKYKAASITLDLLREVQAGKTGFVLLLWGFGSKTWHLDGANISSIDPRADTDSGAFKLTSEESLAQKGIGFRLESGSNWEENVCLLISAASFIILLAAST